MTGGVAYVYDESGGFPERINAESVVCCRPEQHDAPVLWALLNEHIVRTQSVHATQLALRWDEVFGQFWRVAPRSSRAPAVLEVESQATVAAATGGQRV